jgi:hypothetical protein
VFTSLRAASAVAMLGGFRVLVGTVAAALVLLDVAAFAASPPLGFTLGFPIAAAVLALLRRPRAVARFGAEDVPGVVVVPLAQPGLWGLVHQVADGVRVPPPTGVHVLAGATAGVVDRTLYLGAPLLACLREELLAAVLGQVLAPQPAVITGWDRLTRVLARSETRRWVAFRLYAKVFFALARPARERHDAAADQDLAAEVARIDIAWRMFVDRHLTAGWDAGYLPLSPFDGFLAFWAEIEDLPESSLDLLVDPLALLDDSVRLTMVDDADTKTRVDWVTLDHIAGRHAAILATTRLLDAAARVTLGPGTLGAVLDALDAGRLADLGPTDDRPGAANAGPRALREFVRAPVRDDLDAVVGLALADRGLAMWSRTWGGNGVLVVRPPHADRMRELVAAAVAERGSTAELRAALTDAGVGLDYRPEVH